MNDFFKENALSRGLSGEAWLKAIPGLIAKYEKDWSFTAKSPFDLSYNYVAPVVLDDGTSAVVKLGHPEDRDFQSEMRALEIFNGQGICRLLKADHENAVMLLEMITPGTPLATVENDDEATRAIAAVMKQPHKPIPDKHEGLTALGQWTGAIPAYQKKHGSGGPLPLNLVHKAAELFEYLIATSKEPVLVHGDLHHHNVLRSSDRGWVAIDPKGVVAEPAYEVAAMIRNPYDKLKEIENLEPLLRRRIEILSAELGIDRSRIKDWCLAQCVLSAVWNAEGVKRPGHALRVAEVLDDIQY